MTANGLPLTPEVIAQIKDARAQGLTCAQVAALLGVGRRSVNKYAPTLDPNLARRQRDTSWWPQAQAMRREGRKIKEIMAALGKGSNSVKDATRGHAPEKRPKPAKPVEVKRPRRSMALTQAQRDQALENRKSWRRRLANAIALDLKRRGGPAPITLPKVSIQSAEMPS